VLARAAARKHVARILDGTADPEGRGLLLRGLEFQPVTRKELEPRLIEALLELARVAEAASQVLQQHPDPAVRRSAALVAARSHPVRAAFDD
jgi:hypothetical protein